MNAACPAGIAIGIGLGIEGIYYMGAECLVCVCNIDMKLMDVLWPTNFANDKSVFHEPVNCDLIVSVGHANNLSFCLLSALPHSQPEMNVKSERFLGKLWLKFFAKKTEPKINAQVHHRRPKKSIYEINQSLKFMKIYARIAFCSSVKTCIVQHWSPPSFLVHPQGLIPHFGSPFVVIHTSSASRIYATFGFCCLCSSFLWGMWPSKEIHMIMSEWEFVLSIYFFFSFPVLLTFFLS